jgi:hypothetical protein
LYLKKPLLNAVKDCFGLKAFFKFGGPFRREVNAQEKN